MQLRNPSALSSSDSFQLSQREIWASALSLIDSHGDDAIGMASTQAEALIDNGDIAGAELWARILTAIEELQRPICTASAPMRQIRGIEQRRVLVTS